tara:strand:- start:465 stop:602 length:138 start_codon:yes stop_codon:yes gene_type:complete
VIDYEDIILLGLFVILAGFIFASAADENAKRRDNSNIGKTVPRGD